LAGENATNVSRSSGRVKRFLWRTFLALLLLAVVAAIVGASYQGIENSADARRFPQQGRSISLGPAFGDLALNLDCQGQGSPTVVLDSGLGVPGIGWNRVQSDAAKFTRVCWYDRAGYGWSGASSAPRTSLQIVKELHALLAAANEKGPFVLVGHSFGGFNVRVYNGQYPAEVAGMVLVDASEEDQESREPPALQAMMKKYEKSLKQQEALAPLLIRFGIARFAQRNQPPGQGISKEFAQEVLYLQLQPKFIEATASEMELFSTESANEVRTAGNLGDKPLVVLTAGKNVDASQLPADIPKKDMDDFHAIWVNELQVKEAQLSTRGKRILVPDSDHMIPFERPDAVVSAIHDVCAAVNAVSNGSTSADGAAGSR
jgi:pimeloyl-ACP methyl ester carboxylesterase